MRSVSYRFAAPCLGALTALLGACGNFDIQQPEQPQPRRTPSTIRSCAALRGSDRCLHLGACSAQGLIWVVGSMGREGAKLDGKQQPDYQEPFYGPMSPGGIGASFWAGPYAAVRSINIYLQALSPPRRFRPARSPLRRGWRRR